MAFKSQRSLTSIRTLRTRWRSTSSSTSRHSGYPTQVAASGWSVNSPSNGNANDNNGVASTSRHYHQSHHPGSLAQTSTSPPSTSTFQAAFYDGVNPGGVNTLAIDSRHGSGSLSSPPSPGGGAFTNDTAFPFPCSTSESAPASSSSSTSPIYTGNFPSGSSIPDNPSSSATNNIGRGRVEKRSSSSGSRSPTNSKGTSAYPSAGGSKLGPTSLHSSNGYHPSSTTTTWAGVTSPASSKISSRRSRSNTSSCLEGDSNVHQWNTRTGSPLHPLYFSPFTNSTASPSSHSAPTPSSFWSSPVTRSGSGSGLGIGHDTPWGSVPNHFGVKSESRHPASLPPSPYLSSSTTLQPDPSGGSSSSAPPSSSSSLPSSVAFTSTLSSAANSPSATQHSPTASHHQPPSSSSFLRDSFLDTSSSSTAKSTKESSKTASGTSQQTLSAYGTGRTGHRQQQPSYVFRAAGFGIPKKPPPRDGGFFRGPASTTSNQGNNPSTSTSSSSSSSSSSASSSASTASTSASTPIPGDEIVRGVGEDAYFVREDALGIADGVGGWVQHAGTNSAWFSRGLMRNSSLELARYDDFDDPLFLSPSGSSSATSSKGSSVGEPSKDQNPSSSTSPPSSTASSSSSPSSPPYYHDIDLVDVLQRAYETSLAEARELGVVGSSTALVVTLKGDEMKIVNVGDCGCYVIRGKDYVFHTEEQQHSFNYPVQLGTKSKTIPKLDAKSYRFQVQENDIVLLMSDGLSDNLFEDDILEEVIRFSSPTEYPAPSSQPPQNSASDDSSAKPSLLHQTLQSYLKSPDSPSSSEAAESQQEPRRIRIARFSPRALSEALVSRAKAVSEDRWALTSPFAQKAIDNGIPFTGGKRDDITAIICIIQSQDVAAMEDKASGGMYDSSFNVL